MILPSEAAGIFQSDLLIRSAILMAIEDLRANPHLLDYAFASLVQDPFTRNEYGQREINNAKRWFLTTKIPVVMSTVVNEVAMPAISISLIESAEEAVTLADVHLITQQDDLNAWPDLTQTFNPISYVTATGQMTVPDTIGIILAPGQQVIDHDGQAHEILEMQGEFTFLIKANTVANFTGSTIRGKRPSNLVQMESVRMRESYSIGCHAQGEQTYLTYLHSLLVFCLYRYKQDFLEARGFERSVVSSTDFRRNDSFDNELTYSRHLTLTGYVQQTWPKHFEQKITAFKSEVEIDMTVQECDGLSFAFRK